MKAIDIPEIKVGDIVTYTCGPGSRVFKGIVTGLWGKEKAFVMRSCGETMLFETKNLSKTEDFIDISRILKRLKA